MYFYYDILSDLCFRSRHYHYHTQNFISSVIFNSIAGIVSENSHHYGYESARDYLFMYGVSFLWGLGSAMMTSLAYSSPHRGAPPGYPSAGLRYCGTAGITNVPHFIRMLVAYSNGISLITKNIHAIKCVSKICLIELSNSFVSNKLLCKTR